MAHLLSFDPSKSISLLLDDAELKQLCEQQGITAVTEKELFEAFWVGYKLMDSPPAVGDAIIASMEFGRDVRSRSIDGGSLKFDVCPGCHGRSGQFQNRRTIDKPFDLIIEKKTLDYIQACFGRWQASVQALRPYFYNIHKMLEAMAKEEKSIDQLQALISERDARRNNATEKGG